MRGRADTSMTQSLRYDWARSVKGGTARIALAGYLVTAVFLAGFVSWAATAPLAGAVVASGVVAASGQNVVVRHLEGGVIKEIGARDGEQVRAGDLLVALDETGPLTQLNRLVKQRHASMAKAARLTAERDGTEAMPQAAAIFGGDPSPEAAATAREQDREFITRLARYRAEQQILAQRLLAIEKAVSGLEAQKTAAERQLAIVREEMAIKKELLDRGLTSRNEYSALMRSEAELVGHIGAVQSQLASLATQSTEAEYQRERLTTVRAETAVSELNDVRTALADIEEQIDAATAVLGRTAIRAPVDGVVVRMLHNAPGGVLRPGDAVLELLPTGDNLVIEARVNPQDINLIRPGQDARLMFSALNMRTTPQVDGSVFYVSADRLVDEASGHPYYVARIRMAAALPDGISMDLIYPGMPVETFFDTEERTFFDYLVRPITDSFRRAFTEE